MKKSRYTAAVLGLTVLLAAGCQQPTPATEPPTEPSEPPTSIVTEPSTTPATDPVLTGWQEANGKRYYYDENGDLYLGWLTMENATYYLDFDGAAATGWVDIGDHTYFFGDDDAMHTGWLEDGGKTYCFQDNGIMTQGWAEINGKRYYFAGDGAMHTGWLYRDDTAYYFLPDGSGAVGSVEIDGKTFHFNPSGVYVILVNPWNYLPEDYEAEIVYVEGEPISAECADALKQMLAACRADGCEPVFLSGHRSMELQTGLYNDNIQKYLNRGYDYDTAVELAGQSVAIPGTSEHQLGLAVDIVDNYNWNLDESQEDTATQKWLMEHCWEYGFILRYPNGTTDITGIIYEPWHYRYVGVEISMELRDLGITLEEYLGAA